jgi:hypothetical protein
MASVDSEPLSAVTGNCVTAKKASSVRLILSPKHCDQLEITLADPVATLRTNSETVLSLVTVVPLHSIEFNGDSLQGPGNRKTQRSFRKVLTPAVTAGELVRWRQGPECA